jgi:hypothetical protein
LCLTDEQLNLLFTITLIELSITYYPNLEDNLKKIKSMNNKKIFNRDNFSKTKKKKLEARILLNLNITVFKNYSYRIFRPGRLAILLLKLTYFSLY